MDYGPFGFVESYSPLFAKWTGSGEHFGFINQVQAGFVNWQVGFFIVRERERKKVSHICFLHKCLCMYVHANVEDICSYATCLKRVKTGSACVVDIILDTF
jgi:hypothetical protein